MNLAATFYAYNSTERIIEMSVINLKNGYCIIPESFVLLEDQCDKPEESENVYIVEVLNGYFYGVPHFVFYRTSSVITDADFEGIYSACYAACPYFEDTLNAMISLEKEHGVAIEPELLHPYLGIFRIVADDDDWYDPDHIYPYGMVVHIDA